MLGNSKKKLNKRGFRKLISFFLVLGTLLNFFLNSFINSAFANTNITSAVINTDYLIIVENSNLSKAVLPLVNLRKSQGLNVNIINAPDIYKTYKGTDNADKIRNYLMDKYRIWNLKYLLLVGDEKTLPYKMLYPSYLRIDSNTEVGRTPSNFFYSDLSSDFDADKDYYPGEYVEDDKEMDFSTEIMVGRIPFSSAQDVYNTINNIINFEKAQKTKNVLLSASILSYENEEISTKKTAKRTDGATLTDAIYKDLLKLNGYKVNRLYEKSGLSSSLYESEYPLKKANFENLLKNNNYDLFLWNGHGTENELLTKIWVEDRNKNKKPDKNEIIFSNVLSKDSFRNIGNRMRGIFITGSCSSIKPEGENIGKEALNAGFACYIGGTRINWFAEDWKNINDGGNQTLLYFTVRNLILRNNTIGEALYSALEEYATGYKIYGNRDLQNIYSFNLYGDPALRLNPIEFKDIYASVDNEEKAVNLGEDLEFLFNVTTEGGENQNISFSAIDYKKDTITPFFYPNTIRNQGDVRLKLIMAKNTFPTMYCITIHIKTNTKNVFKILRFLILPWENGPQIYLSYPRYNIVRNTEFTVDVCLKDVANVDTVYTEITFDSTIISPNVKSIINGEFLTRDGIMPIKQINSISQNTIGIYYTRGKYQKGISGNGLVYSINFRSLRDGYSDIKITRYFVFNPFGSQINLKKFDSNVTVSNTGLFINKNIASGEITSKQFLTINGSLNGETLWIGDDTYKYLIEVRENGKYSEILKLMSYKNSIEFITQRESNDFNKIRVEILTNSIVSITLKIGNSTAIVNEKEVFLDTAPILENGRTLVPIRFISESIGANVKWNDKDLSIVITLGDKKIYLWIGKKESIIEKKGVKTTYKLDVPPRIVNNRTLVPLRFVMEAFSATVTWIDEYKLIKINYYK